MSDVSKQQDWTNPAAMAIREWLKGEGTWCAPHHDVGFTGDAEQRQMESNFRPAHP